MELETIGLHGGFPYPGSFNSKKSDLAVLYTTQRCVSPRARLVITTRLTSRLHTTQHPLVPSPTVGRVRSLQTGHRGGCRSSAEPTKILRFGMIHFMRGFTSNITLNLAGIGPQGVPSFVQLEPYVLCGCTTPRRDAQSSATFFLEAASATRPEPNRSIVEGSGTGHVFSSITPW